MSSSSSSSARRRIRTSTSNVMYTNAVYFPNQKIYNNFTPGMMNYSCINHVYYAYANVSSNGSVLVSRLYLAAVFISPIDPVSPKTDPQVS